MLRAILTSAAIAAVAVVLNAGSASMHAQDATGSISGHVYFQANPDSSPKGE